MPCSEKGGPRAFSAPKNAGPLREPGYPSPLTLFPSILFTWRALAIVSSGTVFMVIVVRLVFPSLEVPHWHRILPHPDSLVLARPPSAGDHIIKVCSYSFKGDQNLPQFLSFLPAQSFSGPAA
jgi:hypothetical protein